ncbi:MAG: gluconate 2-dehydrogenase subunit 3 family protein [Planctomycetota bacterium]
MIAAVQELLLPPDDLGPGASDVNAIGYLDAVLGEPGLEPEVAPRLKSGAERLDRLCRQHHRRPFVGLDVALRERALLELDGQPEGRAWITELLGFLLEALLGDPARGANPDELGWKWLGYEPPLPRPPHPGWQPRESS